MIVPRPSETWVEVLSITDRAHPLYRRAVEFEELTAGADRLTVQWHDGRATVKVWRRVDPRERQP